MSARGLLRWAPAATLMAVIAWLSHQPRWPRDLEGYPDWLLHGGAYGTLALLCYWGASEGLTRSGARPAFVAGLVSSAYGALDELHQSFVPGRHGDVRDWAVDSIATVAVILVVAAVRAFGGVSGGMGQSRT